MSEQGNDKVNDAPTPRTDALAETFHEMPDWHAIVDAAVEHAKKLERELTMSSAGTLLAPTKEMIEAGRMAIMGMLEPKRVARTKPTIAELEAILNADNGANINLEPDGSVTELTPRTTTAAEVAKTAYEAMVALAPVVSSASTAITVDHLREVRAALEYKWPDKRGQSDVVMNYEMWRNADNAIDDAKMVIDRIIHDQPPTTVGNVTHPVTDRENVRGA